MSASSITRLGMVGCAVLDQTVRAVMDIPGVLATSLKAGACGFGEAASVRKTWWQPEQTCCAYANPFPASPTSAIRVTAGVLVLLVGHLSPVFIGLLLYATMLWVSTFERVDSAASPRGMQRCRAQVARGARNSDVAHGGRQTVERFWRCCRPLHQPSGTGCPALRELRRR